MARYGFRPHVESGLCLDVQAIFRDGPPTYESTKQGLLAWKRTPDGKIADLMRYELIVRSQNVGYVRLLHAPPETADRSSVLQYEVMVTATTPHFGGRRWWFQCPYTGRRVAKVYLFPSMERFCSRLALNPAPTYACQRESGHQRTIGRRRRIRMKLAAPMNFHEPIECKPKWMRWRTFWRLANKEAALAV